MMTGTASWRLESKEDIDRYMDSLRKSLEAQLDEDTIVNVEFLMGSIGGAYGKYHAEFYCSR